MPETYLDVRKWEGKVVAAEMNGERGAWITAEAGIDVKNVR